MVKLNTNLCFSFDLFCMLTLSCLEFLDNSYINLKLSVIESLQGYPGHPAWRSHHERHDRGQHGRGQGQQGGRQVPVLTQFCLFFRELMFCFQLGIVVALFFLFCYASKAMDPKLYTMILYCASGSLWKMPDSNLGPLPQQSGALAMSDYMFFFYPINARQKIMSNFGHS